MRHKGQSTVEYILLVTAVIAVVIMITGRKDSIFQTKLGNAINTTTDGMQNMAIRLTNTMVGGQ